MEGQIKFDSKEIFNSFNQSVGDLTTFLRPDDEKVKNFRQLTCKLFDCLKDNSGVAGIKNLVTRGFDEEQIWAQIEQDNRVYLNKLGENVSSLSVAAKKAFKSPKSVKKPRTRAPIEDNEEEDLGDLEGLEDFEDLYEDGESDMEFASEDGEDDSGEEDDEEDDDDDDDDEEDDDDNEEGDEDLDEDLEDVEDDEIEGAGDETNYSNLIGPVSSDEDDDDDDDIDRILGPREVAARKGVSSFEKEQQLLKERIAKLEDENLAAKPWKLTGEITADKRPTNSLLEDHLQYDFVARPAPIIDKDVAENLENLIKQRIKDGIWDDVERKVKPVEKPFEYKRRLILDQEKSKVGLGEIYEKDYLQRKTEEKAEEENETHKEIRKMMGAIFLQLDALSSYHFTPKPPEPEIKLIKNLPAITAEEAIPLSIGEGTLLAPEEVKEKPKRPIKGETEKDSTDRKHNRRVKKYRQKLIAGKKNKNQPSSKVTSQLDSSKHAEKIEKTKKMKQFKISQLKT